MAVTLNQFQGIVNGLSKILGINTPAGNPSLDEVAVNSSAISNITYNTTTQVLSVVFKESGIEYFYTPVDDQTANDFINASSIGKFFNREIKGNYIYWR